MASIHHDLFVTIPLQQSICLSAESDLPQTACHGGCQTSGESNVLFWCWPCSFLVVTRGYQHHPGWILEMCGMQVSKVKFSKRHDDLWLMMKLHFQVDSDSRAFHHEKWFVVVTHGFPIVYHAAATHRDVSWVTSSIGKATLHCTEKNLASEGDAGKPLGSYFLGLTWCCF